MRERHRTVCQAHVRALMILILCCRWSAQAVPHFVKLGVDQVHDEQTVDERREVLTIMQQLQAASITKKPYTAGNSDTVNGGLGLPTPTLTPSSQYGNKQASFGYDDDGSAETKNQPPDDNLLAETNSVQKPETFNRSADSDNTDAQNQQPGTQHKNAENAEQDNNLANNGTEQTEDTKGVACTEQNQTTSSVSEKGDETGGNTTDSACNTTQPQQDNGDPGPRPIGPEALEVPVDTGLLFEGDIMLTVEDAQGMLHAGKRRRRRKVTYSKDKLWTLPIPYLFVDTPKYKLNSSEMKMVQQAIAHLEGMTCITFRHVNVTDPIRPILRFKKDVGCWSYVGREHAFHFQEVSTGEGCFEFGTLMHELGHAIGFWHEHSRPDRHAFIRVHTENVRRGEEFNFKVESWGELDNMNVPYDVSSIMHYGSTYFSRSGREVTVEAVDGRLQRVLGQRHDMSFYDVKLANLAYCSDVCADSSVAGKCQHEGYPDPKRCERCRCPPGLSGTTCQQVALSKGMVCGGRLSVGMGQSYTISSPSHPWPYPANVQCSWLIQASAGMQVVVNVSKEDFMTHPECSPYPITYCTDYLEIKYNASFGFTGARYCCGLPPQGPVRSSSSDMLILFHTRRSGKGGFIANVTAESCGGCHPGPSPQPACRKRVEKECIKKWNSSQYVTCPVYFNKASPDCNVWITKKKTRLALCTTEVEYCCDGYHVINGLCYPSSSNSSSPPLPVTPDPKPDKQTDVTDIGQDADSSWSTWSPWQQCSRSCGGCGMQTRRRTCDIPTRCSGQSQEEQSRACNTFTCPDLVVYICTTTRVKDYFCGWGKCYRLVTETGPCFTACCPGYVELAGKCVPRRR